MLFPTFKKKIGVKKKLFGGGGGGGCQQFVIFVKKNLKNNILSLCEAFKTRQLGRPRSPVNRFRS